MRLKEFLLESAETDGIWKRLMDYKKDIEETKEVLEISPEEEKTIKADIDRKLKSGWTKDEVYKYLR